MSTSDLAFDAFCARPFVPSDVLAPTLSLTAIAILVDELRYVLLILHEQGDGNIADRIIAQAKAVGVVL